MENLKDKIQAILTLSTDDLLARFGLLVFFIYLAKGGVVASWCCFPLIGGMLAAWMLEVRVYKNRWFWLAASSVLLLDIIFGYWIMANHHFVLFYFCLVLFIAFSSLPNEREEIFDKNSRWIIAGVLFFAAFQKVLTVEYATGSYFATMVLTGEFFQPITFLFPDIQEIMEENEKIHRGVRKIEPQFEESFLLTAPFPYFQEITIFFAYLVALGELLVGLMFLFFKNKKWSHILLISIILGVFLTRLETGFLSILCLFGLAYCLPQHHRFRLIYLGLILFFSALILIGKGFE